ncbi:hypothetical protein SDRG_11310 [Saprolegnia diclina VS20]|uniref:Uncharacterized protein n=1 Tax=Saprolegnia diclina (strain VS20) TaxID=1156394 RepID=T0QC43_SAPDV|nr:hypothetical protein SDRG_11310 [Saprolegnia diclina VS20]EQC31125.1 hypothetical protein SDRG_11310 [Saprolegnia diclina VS20]|eukprot:XP_008615564.1 hypothetical protein SDRG_11310 [Saprolegnia diclina VS20]
MDRYCSYARMATPTPRAPPTPTPAAEQAQAAVKKKKKPQDQLPALSNDQDPSGQQAPGQGGTEEGGGSDGKKKYPCAHCHTMDHNMWTCPIITDRAERIKLINEARARQAQESGPKPNVSAVFNAGRTLPTPASRTLAARTVGTSWKNYQPS